MEVRSIIRAARPAFQRRCGSMEFRSRGKARYTSRKENTRPIAEPGGRLNGREWPLVEATSYRARLPASTSAWECDVIVDNLVCFLADGLRSAARSVRHAAVCVIGAAAKAPKKELAISRAAVRILPAVVALAPDRLRQLFGATIPGSPERRAVSQAAGRIRTSSRSGPRGRSRSKIRHHRRLARADCHTPGCRLVELKRL